MQVGHQYFKVIMPCFSLNEVEIRISSHKETLSHLFSTCDDVKILWKELAEYIHQRFNITQISLETTKIITNKTAFDSNANHPRKSISP